MRLIGDRWIERIVKKGCTSTPEEWSSKGSWRNGKWFSGILRTQSHAWSASPAYFLIFQLAGLQILEPGMKRIRLAPAKTDFTYTIKLPTPHGCLRIQWDGSIVDVDAPEGPNIDH